MTARTNPKPIEHGTDKGYGQHRHRGDVERWKTGELERCQPCTDAHAKAGAAWRAERARNNPGRRPMENTYLKAGTTRVPNELLGALLLAAPPDLADTVTDRLSEFVVKRALWAARRTNPDQPFTTRGAA